jgi:uncharacterized membrane protein YfcA
MADWSDVRWKPAQLQAILRVRLYAHWLRVTLSALCCALAGLVLWTLRSSWPRDRRPVLAATAGAGLGFVLFLIIAWPLRRDGLLWAWPAAWPQAVMLTLCAALGASLSLWRGED